MLPDPVRFFAIGGRNDLKGSGNFFVWFDRKHPIPGVRDAIAKALKVAGFDEKRQKALPRDMILCPGRRDDPDQAEMDRVLLEILGEHLKAVFPARGVWLAHAASILAPRDAAMEAEAQEDFAPQTEDGANIVSEEQGEETPPGPEARTPPGRGSGSTEEAEPDPGADVEQEHRPSPPPRRRAPVYLGPNRPTPKAPARQASPALSPAVRTATKAAASAKAPARQALAARPPAAAMKAALAKLKAEKQVASGKAQTNAAKAGRPDLQPPPIDFEKEPADLADAKTEGEDLEINEETVPPSQRRGRVLVGGAEEE